MVTPCGSARAGAAPIVGAGSRWGRCAVSEPTLSRIPFTVRDERMIQSMARWMRFIGIVKAVSGLATLFLVFLFLIYISAERSTAMPALGKIGPIIAENLLWFFALGVFGLILGAVGTMLGFVLYQA